MRRRLSVTPAARERWQIQAPALAIAAVAWILLIARSSGSTSAGSCCPILQPGKSITSANIAELFHQSGPSTLVIGWSLMLAAMMGPMLAIPVRHVVHSSLARRRLLFVVLFLIGYLCIWMIAGTFIMAAAIVAPVLSPNHNVPVLISVVILILWQCSPAKQRCLNRGHSHTPLAVFGAKATADVFRFGVIHGLWCVGSCWALMLLPEMLPTGHVAAMAIVTLWFSAERLERPMPPQWRLPKFGKTSRLIVARLRRVTTPRTPIYLQLPGTSKE